MPVRILRHVPDNRVERVVAAFTSSGCDVEQEREADGNGWKVTANCPGAMAAATTRRSSRAFGKKAGKKKAVRKKAAKKKKTTKKAAKKSSRKKASRKKKAAKKKSARRKTKKKRRR